MKNASVWIWIAIGVCLLNVGFFFWNLHILRSNSAVRSELGKKELRLNKTDSLQKQFAEELEKRKEAQEREASALQLSEAKIAKMQAALKAERTALNKLRTEKKPKDKPKPEPAKPEEPAETQGLSKKPCCCGEGRSAPNAHRWQLDGK